MHEPGLLPSYCLTYCEQDCIVETLAYEFDASLVFSILTLLISVYNICMHLYNFNNPFFQSKIISKFQPMQSYSSCRPSTASPLWAPSSSLYVTPKAESINLLHAHPRFL
jgi:hypothetical protein